MQAGARDPPLCWSTVHGHASGLRSGPLIKGGVYSGLTGWPVWRTPENTFLHGSRASRGAENSFYRQPTICGLCSCGVSPGRTTLYRSTVSLLSILVRLSLTQAAAYRPPGYSGQLYAGIQWNRQQQSKSMYAPRSEYTVRGERASCMASWRSTVCG